MWNPMQEERRKREELEDRLQKAQDTATLQCNPDLPRQVTFDLYRSSILGTELCQGIRFKSFGYLVKRVTREAFGPLVPAQKFGDIRFVASSVSFKSRASWFRPNLVSVQFFEDPILKVYSKLNILQGPTLAGGCFPLALLLKSNTLGNTVHGRSPACRSE